MNKVEDHALVAAAELGGVGDRDQLRHAGHKRPVLKQLGHGLAYKVANLIIER